MFKHQWAAVVTLGAAAVSAPATVDAAPLTVPGTGQAGPSGQLDTYTASMPRSSGLSGFERVDTIPRRLGSFDIVIDPGPTLAANSAALDAFNRAAARWESFIADPITVNINADLASFSSRNTIGSASSVTLFAPYSTIRNALVTDAGDELDQTGGFDDNITTFLPTAANFSATLPTGTSLSGNLSATKANLKALGFTGLDATFGPNDATIRFNNAFTFDFDNRDGVNGTDFETVALHEIGHALGFISVVDEVNEGATSIAPTTLDLYRFTDDTAADPETFAEFTTAPRQLTPGVEAVFDEIVAEYQLSTGTSPSSFPNVDGQQASHWKDASPGVPNASPFLIGVMDPTLAAGQVFPITMADLRAFDLIGYEIGVVPEPGTGALVVIVVTALCVRRRRAA